MTKPHKKRAAWIIIPAALLAFLILSFAVTGAVYARVFRRFDKSAPYYPAREEFAFKSGKNELKGFLYGRGSDELIVIVSGFRAIQEDCLPLVTALTDEGFSVFTFDPTGVGRSGGRDQKGFPQIVQDLDACLDLIEENGRFGCSRITLLGHSRGGFAACMEASRADRVITVGGLASTMDGVLQGAYTKVGKAVYLNYPLLYLWQTILFGKDGADASAVDALLACDTEVLVIQGGTDKSVPADRFSVYSKAPELSSRSNISFAVVSGGHVDVLYSDGRANPATLNLILEFLQEDEELAA
ncbi:MAG: lysophospholipase [Clostridiales bacterium]|nr:lysophospholipase [Clostridiales bacterium]